MRKLLFILSLLVSINTYAQTNYTNINGRYRWIAGIFDSTFHIPKGTNPALRTGGWNSAGALYYKTTDSSIYAYTGSQWLKVANAHGFVPYVGATTNLNLGQYGVYANGVTFQTVSPSLTDSIGRLKWDSDYGTAKLGLAGGNVQLQIGQEQVALVHNNTGSTITNGQVVYIYNSTGELPSVKLASDTSEQASSITFGVATEDISHGSNGYVTISGMVHGLNTNALTEGAALWLGTTPGTFTQTKPQAPNNAVLIGYVIKKSGGNGSIFVKIQNGYELDELHNVKITNPTTGEVLAYNASTGLWVDTTLNGIGGVTGSGTSNYIPKFTGTNSIGNSSIFDNGTNVGVKTASPLYPLDVNGLSNFRSNMRVAKSGSTGQTINFESGTGGYSYLGTGFVSVGSSYENQLTIHYGTSGNAVNLRDTYLSSGQSYYFPDQSGTLALTSDIPSLSGYVPYSGATSNVNLGSYGLSGNIITATNYFKSDYYRDSRLETLISYAGSNKIVIGSGVLSDYLSFYSGATEKMRLDASGNLGLGVTPSAWATYKAFEIGYTGNGMHATGQNDLNIASNVYYNAGYKYAGTGKANLLEMYNGEFYFNTAGSGTAGNAISFTQAMTLTSSQNLLIGTTTDAGYKLDVNGTGRFSGSLTLSNTNPLILSYAGNSDIWLSGGGPLRIINQAYSTALFTLANSGAATFSSSVTAGGDIQGVNGYFTTKVGIGTNNYVARLNVATNNNRFEFDETSSTNAYLEILNSTRSASNYFSIYNRGFNVFTRSGGSGSYVQSFTLTDAGSVGIGTSSPVAKLNTYYYGGYTSNLGDNIVLGVGTDGGGVGTYTQIGLGYNNGSAGNYYPAIIASVVENSSGQNAEGIAFATRSATTGTTRPTERMRITSGGNVGIGTNSPTSIFHVNTSSQLRARFYSSGAASFLDIENAGGSFYVGKDNGSGTDFGVGAYSSVIWSVGAYPLVFSVNNTERMRITSGGNVLVGTTTDNGYKFQVNGGAYIDNVLISPFTYTNTTANAANIYMGSTGTFERSTSSIKYKTDVRDYDKGLAEVLQMRPVYYKGKNDGSKQFAGLIAEEIDSIGLKEFVQYASDGSPDALAYQNMVALLTKAIQELKQELDTLKQQVEILKNK